MPGLRDTLIPDFDMSPAKGKALIREWKSRYSPLKGSLRAGEIYFMQYTAEAHIFDQNPVILTIRTGKKYTLAFNINWLNKSGRRKLIQHFMKYKAHEQKRLARLVTIKKLKKLKFPRQAYRLYFTSVIKQKKIYNLTIGDFYAAVTRNLIHKVKVKE